MHPRNRQAFVSSPPLPSIGLLAVFAAASAGCASPQIDAQWRSTELPSSYLRGATVLVSCETRDLILKRICEDQVVADLATRGARAVLPAPGTVAATEPGSLDTRYLPAARDSGAKAVLSVSLGASSQNVSQGIAIGLGGFGFGRYSGAGIGVSAPIGGGRVNTGYSADGRVTDVRSGRLMWTARASTPPSSDVNAQLADLSRTVLDAAGTAGLF
jgi:hypothetical protein